MRLTARLTTLERQQRRVSGNRLRVVVSRAGKPCDLSKATCSRTLFPNGHLMEIVDLKGGDYDLREDDLENFIQSFPVERRAR